MTAALGEVAAGAGETAAGTEAATAAKAAPKSAPTSSAPVGTARPSAGRSGSKPRTRAQLRPKKSGGGGGGNSATARGTNQSKSTTAAPKRALNAVSRAIGPSKARLGRSGARQLLVAEFVLCTVILALSPLTDKHKSDTPAAWMKRGTAICALFIVLGLVSAGGPKAAKVAASFGGIATVALLVADRDIFVTIAQRFGTTAGTGPAGPPGETGNPVAGALGVGGEAAVPTTQALGGG